MYYFWLVDCRAGQTAALEDSLYVISMQSLCHCSSGTRTKTNRPHTTLRDTASDTGANLICKPRTSAEATCTFTRAGHTPDAVGAATLRVLPAAAAPSSSPAMHRFHGRDCHLARGWPKPQTPRQLEAVDGDLQSKSCKFWANPVHFRLECRPGRAAGSAVHAFPVWRITMG